MTESNVVIGVLLEDAALSLEELAWACEVEPGWVVQRVEAGILGAAKACVPAASWQFSSADLARARRLCAIERAFEADQELAALVVDLSEDVQRLKAQLAIIGQH